MRVPAVRVRTVSLPKGVRCAMCGGEKGVERVPFPRPVSEVFPGLPARHFGAIMADCPWRFRNWSMTELAKRGEKWAKMKGRPAYDVMDTDDICRLPVGELAAKDCVLFLWATFPQLPEALRVMAAWGFTYKSGGVWAKRNPLGRGWWLGLGYWMRGNPELLLLGTRGKPRRIDNTVSNLIVSARRRHSEKPDETYGLVERLVAGPYLELFSRRRWPGWTGWGEQYPDGGEAASAPVSEGLFTNVERETWSA